MAGGQAENKIQHVTVTKKWGGLGSSMAEKLFPSCTTEGFGKLFKLFCQMER